MSGIGGFARSAPESIAIVAPRVQRSFSDLDQRQRRLAGALRGAGVGRADRIALLTNNRPEALEVTTGALRAGIVSVPINALLTEPEVRYLLEDSGARWLFADRPVDAAGAVERIVTFGDAYERLLYEAPVADICDHVLGRPMHYASGPTGRPKGVWAEPVEDTRAAEVSQDFRTLWGLQSDEVHLVCSPLAHSAPHRFATRTLEAGGTVVLTPRFDVEEALRTMSAFRVTSTFMVPTHLERIAALDERKRGRNDVSSVRLLAHAGAPIREVTKRAAIDLFPSGSVWEFYGATEGQATRISTQEWLRKPGSVGLPRPGAEISIRDAQGRVLDSGRVGEVWVSDPSIERFEYWQDPEKTAAAWQGGAFTVGDLGYVDEDGYLFLTGRKDDTIITGGVNVYPQEVEAVLLAHPSVADAAVYGAPNDEWGEEVRALIVPRAGFDADELRRWARERLAGFKCPRHIDVVDELPRTATGKVLRRPV